MARSAVRSITVTDETADTPGHADPTSEDIGYADAMKELEAILDDLDDDDLDVDVLAAKVERASTLIQLGRDRIGAARVQVERVVASLDETSGDGALFATDDSDDE